MTNDNQDALRCADALDAGENFYAESSMWFDSKLSDATADASDHLRRLVQENEAKDALLRQALAAIVWECGSESSFYAEKTRSTIAAIRQHLEGRA